MVEYKLIFDDYAGNWSKWQDNSASDYSSTLPADRVNQGYWTNSDGENPDGSQGSTWA